MPGKPASLITVMEMIAGRFQKGQRTTTDEISNAMGISRAAASEILQRLVQTGLLHRLGQDNDAVCLARSPEKITAAELIEIGFHMIDESGAQRSEFFNRLRSAQRELADMQSRLRTALRQKSHLAALGTAVSKINHDLRNILATAQLVSDRLAGSEDPEVKRVAPTLVRSLDRAAALCANVLRYGRAEEAEPTRVPFELHALVDDVTVALGLSLPDGVRVENTVDPDFILNADREQVFRVLLNLGRNAAEALTGAGDGRITVSAARGAGVADIRIRNIGPGVPAESVTGLFQAFSGSSRSGGTGLGLAIARDLMVGHGGDIKLLETGATGTVFQLLLPQLESASAA